MNFTDYQEASHETAIYPAIGHGVIYPCLGLTNEAGEVAGKIKKIFRDKGGVFGDKDREDIGAELGDVLWYLSQVASELGISLDTVASNNIDKLLSRKNRNVLKGSGDNR